MAERFPPTTRRSTCKAAPILSVNFGVTDSRVNLRSSWTTSQLETIAFSGADIYVESGGLLDNSGDEFTTSADQELLLNGGTISGGTIASSDATTFRTLTDSTLRGVTLNVDSVIQDTAIVTVQNGLDVNATLRIERTTNSSSNTYDTGINFSEGDQTLGGTGTVELFSILNNGDENNLRIRPTNGAHLTIGPDVTIQNATNSQFTTIGNSGLPLTILGTIVSQSSGKSLRVTGSTVNNGNGGRLRAQGGVLDVNNASGELGDASVSGGGTLDVAGTFTNNVGQTVDASTLTFSGEWTNTAAINATGGAALNLAGSWSNSGSLSATDSTVSLIGVTDQIGSFSSNNTQVNVRNRYTTAQLESISHDQSDVYVQSGWGAGQFGRHVPTLNGSRVVPQRGNDSGWQSSEFGYDPFGHHKWRWNTQRRHAGFRRGRARRIHRDGFQRLDRQRRLAN